MLFALGRGMAPAAAVAGLLLIADALLTEGGRPLAAEDRRPLTLDAPPPLALENGAALAAETGGSLNLDGVNQ